MIKWVLKPYVIVGIGVGVGVVTCVVRILRQQNKEEILHTHYNRITRAVKIPKEFVGHVLGRGGSTINGIRQKSGARITFDDTEKDFTVASVKGSIEEVEEAVSLINNILTSRHACATKEIILQDNITDSIWKNVHCIRQICDLTRVKTIFEFLPTRSKGPSVKILLKGKKEEVEAASELIDQLVAEVEVNSSKQIHVAGRALPQNQPLQITSLMSRSLPCEKLIPNSSDGYLEVYVSAVDNPNKFWVQISGSKSIQLDKLAIEMTDFYNEEKNKAKFQLSTINVGDIVAAFFQGDNSWYRAQVLKVVQNDELEDKKISVFYLDFGDCAVLSPTLVSSLKPDYLSIPFQAIACSLANVVALDEKWTQEATEEFEKLVYLGQWKVIMAKPVKKPAQSASDSVDSIEFIELLDTNTDADVDIGNALVARGLAKYSV